MNPREILQRCPFCQAVYAKAAIQSVITRRETAPMVYHCACTSCKKAVMAFVHEQGPWLSSVGMFTELSADEARQMSKLPPISSDICLRVHSLVEGSSREFCRFLLKQA